MARQTLTLTVSDITNLTNTPLGSTVPWQLNLVTYSFLGPGNYAHWADTALNTNPFLNGVVIGATETDIQHVSTAIEAARSAVP